jgi:hypothetical protein
MINLETASPKELYQARSGIRTLRACCGLESILTPEREAMFDLQEKELTEELAKRGWGEIVPLAWDF